MLAILSILTPKLLTVVCALIVLLCFLVVWRKSKEKSNLEKKYIESLESILFMLNVEDEHCKNNKIHFDKTYRNTMRDYAKVDSEISWNSKFSKSRCVSELEKYKEKVKSTNNFYIEALQSLLLKFIK